MSRFTLVLACGALASSCSLANAAPRTHLKMNGRIASTHVQTVGGVAMVPVADVARALGQSLVPIPGGWEIRVASGTFQAGRLSGRMGDVLQTPKYSFQVLNLQTTSEYHSRFLKTPATFVPDAPADVLVIVNCRIKNTLPKAQGPVLQVGNAGRTALTDNANHSYAPKSYDSRIASDFSGASMLPGSTSELALVFSVPRTAHLKDLVFTVTDYFELGTPSPDVRVSLR